MKQIVRLYLYADGKETCIKDPQEMIRLLSDDARGFAKVATSKDLIGETVQVGEVEITIINH